MPYYVGDYYRGDYYTGDPFALPVLGALATKVAGKVIPGIARKIVGIAARPKVAGTIAATAAFAGTRTTAPAPPGMIPKPGWKGTIQRILPGGETGYIKRRRMNVTNVRALRRAIRRAEGFRKMAVRVLSFSKGRRFGGQLVKYKRSRKG